MNTTERVDMIMNLVNCPPNRVKDVRMVIKGNLEAAFLEGEIAGIKQMIK